VGNAGDTKTRGGLCCDYCSDTKFPCIFMEKQMKGELKKNPLGDLKRKIKGVLLKAED